MRTPAVHEFEGRPMTVAEIKKIVPVLSRAAIADHIRAGRTTRQQMLGFDSRAAMRVGGARGRAASPNLTFAKGHMRP